MSDPEVSLARYLALAALAVLLVSRALISVARGARARAAARHPSPRYAQPAQVAEVVADVKDEMRPRPKSRAAPRPTHRDDVPAAGSSVRDLRAAIVTMEIFGPPRGLRP